MDEQVYKNFSISFYNKLKNTVNARVKCTVDAEKDILYITISRLGIEYETSVKEVSTIIANSSEADKAFDAVVKRYRSWVLHKYFYD